MFSENLWALF